MNTVCLLHNTVNGLFRIQRRVRILKNNLNFLLIFHPLRTFGFQDAAAFKQYSSVRCLMQPHDNIADGRFSASGFAHQTKRLSRLNGEADTIHRMQHAFIFHLKMLI